MVSLAAVVAYTYTLLITLLYSHALMESLGSITILMEIRNSKCFN